MSGIASEKKRKRRAVDQGRGPRDGRTGPGEDSAGWFRQEDRGIKCLQMPAGLHYL